MQLQASLDDYKARGLGVAAISYDSNEILKNFGDRMNITFPMLSDPGSRTIRAFGILNSQVPENSAQFGIPHPGIYIVDPNGVIVSRYFEENYTDRFTPDTILTREFGASGDVIIEITTEHLKLTLSQTQTLVRAGNRVTLIADVELPPKMHLYAPGVQGYIPVSFNIQEKTGVTLHPAQFPPSHILMLPAINERVPVFEGRIRIARDVTVSAQAEGPIVEFSGTFEYQACDDQICYIPKKVPIVFSIQIENHDRQRVPQPLRRTP